MRYYDTARAWLRGHSIGGGGWRVPRDRVSCSKKPRQPSSSAPPDAAAPPPTCRPPDTFFASAPLP
jgi:hypothetical protein